MGKSSSEFVGFVRDQLAALGDLEASRFFGGTGLRSGGVLFGMIMDGTLYFATDEASRAQYVDLGSKPFTFRKAGKLMTTKYMEVPAAVLDDPERLGACASAAIRVSRTRASRSRQPRAR
jgi:DNA transformation protein